jgi:hypothetical protein
MELFIIIVILLVLWFINENTKEHRSIDKFGNMVPVPGGWGLFDTNSNMIVFDKKTLMKFFIELHRNIMVDKSLMFGKLKHTDDQVKRLYAQKHSDDQVKRLYAQGYSDDQEKSLYAQGYSDDQEKSLYAQKHSDDQVKSLYAQKHSDEQEKRHYVQKYDNDVQQMHVGDSLSSRHSTEHKKMIILDNVEAYDDAGSNHSPL